MRVRKPVARYEAKPAPPSTGKNKAAAAAAAAAATAAAAGKVDARKGKQAAAVKTNKLVSPNTKKAGSPTPTRWARAQSGSPNSPTPRPRPGPFKIGDLWLNKKGVILKIESVADAVLSVRAFDVYDDEYGPRPNEVTMLAENMRTDGCITLREAERATELPVKMQQALTFAKGGYVTAAKAWAGA